MKRISVERQAELLDYGLLVLRVGVGGLMLVHGMQKLMGWSAMSGGFPDPLGVGSTTSLALAIFSEVFCSVALIFGVFTRAAVVPLIVTMLVAALLVHGDDPWRKKELAVLYLVPYFTLLLTGAGRWSFDAWRERQLALGRAG